MTDIARTHELSALSWLGRLALLGVLLGLTVVVLGAYVRLTYAGLGCPDWPGCFGKLLPPLEMSPILEITHRFLAASSGVLILAAAVTGVPRARRPGWILLPPLLAVVLLVEVSYFGARVVLQGLAPGWAAVDVGSALLAAALMVAAAVIARQDPPYGLHFRAPLARLSLAAVGLTYAVLVSGVLVAGKNSVTGCLGWPLYSPAQFRMDGAGVANLLRLGGSILAVVLVLGLLVQAWRKRAEHPQLFRAAEWVGAFFLLEALLQGALLLFGLKEGLLVPYTITMAFLWGALVATAVAAAGEKTHRE